MKKSLNKLNVCILVIFLFVALVVLAPVVIGCHASAQCDGGGVAWCQTFGQCDEAACVGIDGLGVRCECDGASQTHRCPPAI